MPPSVRGAVAESQGLMQSDGPEAALGPLRQLLPDQPLSLNKYGFVRLHKQFAAIFAALDLDDLRRMATHAYTKPDDVKLLYEYGWQLVEVGLPDVATSPLYRAHDRMPRLLGFVTELASALEACLLYGEAARVLREADASIRETFVGRYLWLFNEMMHGQADLVRTELPRLQALVGDDEDEAVMLETITQMVARHARIQPISGCGPQDLRGWHFVKMGGLLNYLSDEGFDAGMHGRFGLIADSYGLCHLSLARVQHVLARMEISVPRVLSCGDRSSQIMATALASMLSVPVSTLSADSGAGLIVAYDLADVPEEAWPLIAEHRPGQMLFVHAVNWVQPPPIAPDICSLLYQFIMAPWGERIALPSQNEGADMMPPDDRDASVLAEQICTADYDPADCDLQNLMAVVDAVGDKLTLHQDRGPRGRYWAGGPVLSSRFY